MKITQISYRRIKNLGNFESETVELTATVEEDEFPGGAYRKLKRTAELYLENVYYDVSGDERDGEPELPY